MALKKPAFEETNDTATVTQEGVETVTESAAPAANDTAAMLAPAPIAAAGALATKNEAAAIAKEFERQLAAMQGGDFSYGTYRVFKGSNGEIAEMSGEQTSCGRWAKVHLLNWDVHHEISPGSEDKSSKDFVAYSKDGETIDSVIGEEQKEWVGKPVREYIEYLRNEEDFSKADMRQFVDMACALLATDSGDGPIGTVIQVTLSSSSIPNFKKYTQGLKDTARCVAMGLPGFSMPANPMEFFLLREVASKGNNKWTKLSFCSNLPNKV